MIRYLTPEQVLFIHNQLINLTGGEHGVRDVSMLLSALGRPQATFDGRELYPELFAKGAALLDSLIHKHPFLDGNKRTAIASIGIFFQYNGYQFDVDDKEMVRFTLSCAQGLVEMGEMVNWLKRFCHSGLDK